MSETSEIVAPLVRAINQVPYCWAERLQCGSARGGRMQLCAAGTPDIVVAVRGMLIFLEAKAVGGKVSAAQMTTHERIRRAGGIVHVVRSVAEGLAIVERALNR